MNEPDQWTKNVCKELVITEDLYYKIFIVFFFQIYYSSKATYLAGIANFSIFPDVESYLLEKNLATTEAKI